MCALATTEVDQGPPVILRFYWDTGKCNGNYHLGFKVSSEPLGPAP